MHSSFPCPYSSFLVSNRPENSENNLQWFRFIFKKSKGLNWNVALLSSFGANGAVVYICKCRSCCLMAISLSASSHFTFKLIHACFPPSVLSFFFLILLTKNKVVGCTNCSLTNYDLSVLVGIHTQGQCCLWNLWVDCAFCIEKCVDIHELNFLEP